MELGDEDGEELDLATLVTVTGLVFADRVRDRLTDAGFPPVRFSQLYVFAMLARGPVTVRGLSDRMGFSHQAASQLVAELETTGLARRIPNPDDGRSRLLELTDDGHRLLGAATDARDAILTDLAGRCGGERVEDARAVVAELFSVLGGDHAVRLRDLRLPRSQ